MQNEIWKDVPNYEGLYQVSNLGRVKSLSRKIYNLKTNNLLYTQKEIIKKPKIKKSKRNYYVVGLFKDGKGKDFTIHQLVAMAFLGHKPCGYELVVDHINNNSLDNRVENLQIITHRENCSKDKKNKTSKYSGVSWSNKNKKYCSMIDINGKSTYLGLFLNEYDAYLAYQNKLKEIKNG